MSHSVGADRVQAELLLIQETQLLGCNEVYRRMFIFHCLSKSEGKVGGQSILRKRFKWTLPLGFNVALLQPLLR